MTCKYSRLLTAMLAVLVFFPSARAIAQEAAQPVKNNKTARVRPESRWHGPRWMERHESINARVKKGNVDLLMIGDSITHWWDTDGRKVWDKYYGHRNAVNLAISGDRTQHVLWRLENGNIEDISPKLAVIMIGTNNHTFDHKETAADIEEIVELLRTKLPETKILRLAIFPRGDNDTDGARQVNMKVNQQIAKLGDREMVEFLDINDTFFKEGRRMRRDMLPDGTHPNEKGYAAWAEAMEPMVAKLMGEK